MPALYIVIKNKRQNRNLKFMCNNKTFSIRTKILNYPKERIEWGQRYEYLYPYAKPNLIGFGGEFKGNVKEI